MFTNLSNWFKKFLVSTFLKNEVAALKTRLAEASTALDSVEKAAVSVAKDAAPEVQALGQQVLGFVLSAADKIRAAENSNFVHEWEAKLYADYVVVKADAVNVYQKAQALLEKTVVFFESKL